MRILMIGAYPRSLQRIDGGVAAAITYLSQALMEDNGVELIGVRTGVPGAEMRHDQGFGFPIYDLHGGALGLSTLYRRQARQFAELVDQIRPDIVHGQGADMAGYLAVGCGSPSVVTVHGIIGEDSKYQGSLKARVRSALTGRLIERSTIRRATDLISISPYVAEYYGAEIRGRIHDVPNAIASKYFEVQRSPVPGRVLFAGRLIRRKGVLDLIRAVAQVGAPVRRVVLAGALSDAVYVDSLRQEIARCGLPNLFDFRGLLDERAMLAEFATAEVLVLPSYQETAPMVIQQAMACGVPVLASNVGGIASQICDGTSGMLFHPGDIVGIAASLGRVLTDSELARSLGQEGMARATRLYRAENVAAATLQVYRSALGDPGGCR